MPHRNVANIPLQPVRVLVTGAGGPAAVSVLKSLSADPSVCLIAADMDPWAAGLYLVPPGQRTLIPAGLDPGFVDVVLARCIAMGADVVIPTVDAELRPLGDARTKFAEAGIDLLLAPERALAVTLDKLALARCCASQIPVPRTERFDQVADPQSWTYPVIVKPRTGSGSRGISVVESSQALGRLDASPDFLVQEYLPGEEYSIDVLADAGGRVVAAVPRVRIAASKICGEGFRQPISAENVAASRWLSSPMNASCACSDWTRYGALEQRPTRMPRPRRASSRGTVSGSRCAPCHHASCSMRSTSSRRPPSRLRPASA